ncbi:MAG: transglutaminase domain-containing protein [Rectinemataceae bacterium]
MKKQVMRYRRHFCLTAYCLASLLVVSCISTPATLASVDKAYRERDTTYLQRVKDGAIRAADSQTRLIAEQRLLDILQRQLATDLETAKKNGDTTFLEKVADSTVYPGRTDLLQRRALAYATSLRQVSLSEAIEKANAAEDIAFLDSMVSNTTNRYLSPALKQRAGMYSKAVRAKIEKREAEAKAKETSLKLQSAFEAGDTEYLRTLAAFTDGKKHSAFEIEQGKAAATYLRVLGDPTKSIEKFKNSPLDMRVQNIPLSIKSWISISPEKYLEPLVKTLLAGVYDPFEKVKLIHDWIADNIRYNFEGFLSGKLGDNSWAGVLKSGRSVCAGYANLFGRMCELGGIVSKEISGFSRGYGYDPFTESIRESNHAWNAVRILGKWYLVDVTWDSGYINYFKQNVKDYSPEYLFADPMQFLYSHFPERAEDQLLNNPISWEDFSHLPDLDRAFFDYGLGLPNDLSGGVMKASDSCRIDISCPNSVLLDAVIFDDKSKPIEGAGFIIRQKSTASILASFPISGKYRIVLFARKVGAKSTRFDSAMSIAVDYSGIAQTMPAYPLIYGSYYDLGCNLIAPLGGVIAAGSRLDFSIRIPGVRELGYDSGKGITRLQTDADGVFSYSGQLPDIKKFEVFALDKNGRWIGILKYIVR